MCFYFLPLTLALTLLVCPQKSELLLNQNTLAHPNPGLYIRWLQQQLGSKVRSQKLRTRYSKRQTGNEFWVGTEAAKRGRL
jgi:hypothetical protein